MAKDDNSSRSFPLIFGNKDITWAYFSSVRGWTDMGEEGLYYGVLTSASHDQVLAVLEEHLTRQDMRVFPGGIPERYDVLDWDTRKPLAMYRLPVPIGDKGCQNLLQLPVYRYRITKGINAYPDQVIYWGRAFRHPAGDFSACNTEAKARFVEQSGPAIAGYLPYRAGSQELYEAFDLADPNYMLALKRIAYPVGSIRGRDN